MKNNIFGGFDKPVDNAMFETRPNSERVNSLYELACESSPKMGKVGFAGQQQVADGKQNGKQADTLKINEAESKPRARLFYAGQSYFWNLIIMFLLFTIMMLPFLILLLFLLYLLEN